MAYEMVSRCRARPCLNSYGLRDGVVVPRSAMPILFMAYEMVSGLVPRSAMRRSSFSASSGRPADEHEHNTLTIFIGARYLYVRGTEEVSGIYMCAVFISVRHL